jgi:hypothetical protein
MNVSPFANTSASSTTSDVGSGVSVVGMAVLLGGHGRRCGCV